MHTVGYGFDFRKLRHRFKDIVAATGLDCAQKSLRLGKVSQAQAEQRIAVNRLLFAGR
jgi:hypothetical protein